METQLSERLTAIERGQAELRERLARLEGFLKGCRIGQAPDPGPGRSELPQKRDTSIMTNETEIATRPDLTSQTKALMERAQTEENTQLLKELRSSKALLPLQPEPQPDEQP